jgi:hypothetical protein
MACRIWQRGRWEIRKKERKRGREGEAEGSGQVWDKSDGEGSVSGRMRNKYITRHQKRREK